MFAGKTPSPTEQRRSAGKHQARKPAEEGGLKKFLFTIFGTLAGVLVAALVGDVMIKRNADAYAAERMELVKLITKSHDDFGQLGRELVEIVADRRAATQRLNLYISQGNVAKAVEAYPEYMATVDAWNQRSGPIRTRIRDLTRCDDDWPGEYDIIAKLEGVILVVNQLHPKVGVTANPTDTKSSACPDSLVFNGRALGNDGAGPAGFRSAFEVLRFIHARIIASVDEAVISCVAVAKSISAEQAMSCGGAQAVAWNYIYSTTPECLRATFLRYSPGILCRGDGFGRKRAIDETRFGDIDYWWHLSRQILSAYRAPVLLRTCREHIKGWPKLVGPTCEKLLSEMGV